MGRSDSFALNYVRGVKVERRYGALPFLKDEERYVVNMNSTKLALLKPLEKVELHNMSILSIQERVYLLDSC